MKKHISRLLGRRLPFYVLMLSALAMITVSCEKEETVLPEEPETSGMTITEILESYGEDEAGEDSLLKWGRRDRPTFRTLATALIKTRLIGKVAFNRLTVFAPTDKAFAELGYNPRNISSVPNLKEVLLYHLLGGAVYSDDLTEGFVPTLNGAAVEISLDDGVMVNDANVTKADIRALNGVIHIIDKVLLPPDKNLVELAQSFAPDEFTILVDAVIKAGLTETLSEGGPFTVFAPTNDAFVALLSELGVSSLDDIPEDLLKQVLLYHVVEGRVFSSDLETGYVKTINGAAFKVNVEDLTLTDARGRVANLVPELLNVQATNGVVHVIDRVILPPELNLVELAQSFAPDEFTILVDAVIKAGLTETLAEGGPFTVFAPTNAAFVALLDELGYGGLDEIPVDVLKDVLLYHVVEGRIFSSDLKDGWVKTLNGSFEVDDLTITDANDRESSLVPGLLDVQATNGVVHVIDKVLLPEGMIDDDDDDDDDDDEDDDDDDDDKKWRRGWRFWRMWRR